jgi:hypothetical protein
MGIDWWEHDPALSSGQRDVLEENRRLQQRISELQAGHNTHPDGEIEPGLTGQERQERQERQEQRLEQSSQEHHQDGPS